MSGFTAKLGRTRDGGLKFGETYHAVVARALNKEFTPEFIEFPDGEEFYNIFTNTKNESTKGAKAIHLAETANWIFEGFHTGVQLRVWDVISKKADEEKWGQTLPSALRKFVTGDPKVLIWLRSEDYMPHRNLALVGIDQLISLCERKGAMPVFVGPKFLGVDDSHVGLWDFYCDPWFKPDKIAKQLWFLNLLFERGNVLSSVGMMSGALDGLAMFCGRKVVFFAKKEDACPRMAKVVTAVPSLHWVELFYSGNFQRFSDHELAEIERRIWG